MIRIKIKKKNPLKLRKRLRNKARLRKKIAGTKDRPRLVIFRSLKHIYAQLIDDDLGIVLTEANTLKLRDTVETKYKEAEKIGTTIAQFALKKDINKVVFDRNGFIYHGRVQALAEAARKSGLNF